MSNLGLLSKLISPGEAAKEVARREKTLRRKKRLSQQELSDRSGVSLSSLRRFEQTGQASFEAIVRICRALDCEQDLDALFSKPVYRSIQEVIDDQR